MGGMSLLNRLYTSLLSLMARSPTGRVCTQPHFDIVVSFPEMVTRNIGGMNTTESSGLFIRTLPLIGSPTRPARQGGGRLRFTALVVLNSLLLSVLPPPGRQRSQTEQSLSLCHHAQACLFFLGLCSCRALVRSLDLTWPPPPGPWLPQWQSLSPSL